jgi:GNAT superfamily N-acetyltransferase
MSSTSLDRTLAQEAGPYLITRGNAQLRLRPVRTDDGPLLAEFFSRLSPEDLRFRFLDFRREPSAAEIAAMLEVDHRRGEHVLAFDTASGDLIATLMLIADDLMETADVTISVAADWKDRGIGWTLLRHASDLAYLRGIKKLRSMESRANHDALEVERSLGFRTCPVEGDPSLVVLEAELG